MKRETSISRRSLLVGTACAALGALTGCTAPEPTAAEPQPELILRYAENQPEDYPTTKAALAFAEMVAQRTDGRVKVVVYSGGELGGELSVIEQMQFGGIDFARVSLSQLAGLLENVDLVGLSWFDAGVRSFYTREKAATLVDLQGKVIRVQESDMMSEMVSDMGAVPVQVVYSQVYAALHNGRIDGAENNWPSYEAMGHYEVAPYFLKNEHTRVPEIQIASRAALEKLAGLDSSFPGIVRGCARDSANVERRLWAEREAQAEEDMRAWGVEVTTLSEAEMQKFRAAVRPMYERFAEQAELIRQIQEA